MQNIALVTYSECFALSWIEFHFVSRLTMQKVCQDLVVRQRGHLFYAPGQQKQASSYPL